MEHRFKSPFTEMNEVEGYKAIIYLKDRTHLECYVAPPNDVIDVECHFINVIKVFGDGVSLRWAMIARDEIVSITYTQTSVEEVKDDKESG